MDKYKYITVAKLPQLRFVGIPKNQGRKENMKGYWDP